MKKGAPRSSSPLRGHLKQARIVVLTASWHQSITSRLRTAACQHLRHQGIETITEEEVPGCLELPLAAMLFALRSQVDGLIALGCVLRGETPHFDYVCKGCYEGLLEVSLRYQKPIGMGVVMAHQLEQAEARAQPTDNKGTEAAEALLQMLRLKARIHAD